MYIANLRVTHTTAPHELLDRLSLSDADMKDFYKDFLAIDNIDEAVMLQTCNRFEVYFSGKEEEDGKTKARKFMLDRFGAGMGKHLVVDSYLETLGHLFDVVSSIDSMMVGENQVLAQVKESLEFATMNRHSGRILEPIFQKALSVGKRIRSETKICEGKVSISSAAIDLANQNNPLQGKNVLIIGTGNMASLLAEYLSKFDVKDLVVAGRTPERLTTFCEKWSARPIGISKLQEELPGVDVLFSATACPRVLVTREVVEAAVGDRTRPLTLVDIAMPADIDSSVADIPSVEYYSIDNLKDISCKNMAARQDEVVKARVIIKEELDRLKFKLENLHTERFLSNLNMYTEDIRTRELERAIAMLDDADPKTVEVLQGLSRSLTKKILHNFLTEIRSNPVTAEEMERFLDIFTGNGHVPKHPHEKTEE